MENLILINTVKNIEQTESDSVNIALTIYCAYQRVKDKLECKSQNSQISFFCGNKPNIQMVILITSQYLYYNPKSASEAGTSALLTKLANCAITEIGHYPAAEINKQKQCCCILLSPTKSVFVSLNIV
uniref:Uncharacterized protein n=1 Tax=Heterorhabditis bacteriophora TaxID=37862 RepID=A0A1I7WBH7_HETBA